MAGMLLSIVRLDKFLIHMNRPLIDMNETPVANRTRDTGLDFAPFTRPTLPARTNRRPPGPAMTE